MTYAQLISVALGLLLCVSAGLKVPAPAYRRFRLATHALLPAPMAALSPVITPMVVIAELAVGTALVAGWPDRHTALALGGAILLTFTFAMARGVVRGVTISCACFGGWGSAGGLRVVDVMRNAALVVIVATALSDEGRHVTLAGQILLASLLLIAFWLSAESASEVPESGKADKPSSSGVVGTVINVPPDLLDDATREGRQTVVAILAPGCGGCESTGPYMVELTRSLRYSFIVGYNDEGATREEVARLESGLEGRGFARLTPAQAVEVARTVDAEFFPAFVVLDSDRVIVDVVVGLGNFQHRHPIPGRVA